MMEKQTRVPRQKRSLQKRQLLLDTATELFGGQGYHNTTTNQIAKAAGLSIGSLYAYFADKEALLLALLDQHNKSFDRVFDEMQDALGQQRFQTDRTGWGRALLDMLVNLHRENLAFARELRALYYQIPAVAQAVDCQQSQMRSLLAQVMVEWGAVSSSVSVEATSTVFLDCYTAVVDRVVFGELTYPEPFLDAAAHLLDGMVNSALQQASAPIVP